MALAQVELQGTVVPGLHQLNWPASYGATYSSMCWGCHGKRKRSAESEASPEADPALAYLPYGGFYGYYRPVVYANTGVAAHPGTATSFTYRSPQGLALGRRRRSAEAEERQGKGLLYYPYAYPFYHHVVPVVPAIKGDGVAAHPNLGTSFVGPTTWGFPQ